MKKVFQDLIKQTGRQEMSVRLVTSFGWECILHLVGHLSELSGPGQQTGGEQCCSLTPLSLHQPRQPDQPFLALVIVGGGWCVKAVQ